MANGPSLVESTACLRATWQSSVASSYGRTNAKEAAGIRDHRRPRPVHRWACAPRGRCTDGPVHPGVHAPLG
eukprot:scaffold7786_cov239-Pinguiococcus_pyrenoidosus.AAC.1